MTTLSDHLDNPFRGRPIWSFGGGVAQLGLDTAEANAPLPQLPLLLSGVYGCGSETTAARIVAQARRDHLVTAHVAVTPSRPLLDALVDAVALATGDRATATGPTPTRRAPGGEHRRLVNGRGIEVATREALSALFDAATKRDHGVLVCIEHLHAATRAESEVILRTLAALMAENAHVRAVVTASSALSVDLDPDTRAAWIDVPLYASREQTAQVLGADGRHGRSFTPDAVQMIHDFSGGLAELALVHAAVSWDRSRSCTIGTDVVDRTARDACAAWTARVRERWSSTLSLGQRRYLHGLYTTAGTAWAPIESIHASVVGATRFAPSAMAVDAMLTELARHGLVIVRNGDVRLAVRGVGAVL